MPNVKNLGKGEQKEQKCCQLMQLPGKDFPEMFYYCLTKCVMLQAVKQCMGVLEKCMFVAYEYQKRLSSIPCKWTHNLK